MQSESNSPPSRHARSEQGKRRALSNRRARTWAEERPWPVKALTILLLIQGVGLILIGLLHIDFQRTITEIVGESFFYALLPVLGAGALVATLGFLSLRPGAWVIAMLVQGLSLLLALLAYFITAPDNIFLYGMMLYSIVLVVYLNYAEVPAVFRMYPDALGAKGRGRDRE
jgi:hypothetical protein